MLRPRVKAGDFHVTVEKDFLDAVADALKLKKLNVVETGGDEYQAQREQWDDANNTVALEPGLWYPTSALRIQSARCARSAWR